MKITERTLEELRHLIPKLGRAKDCHINAQLNLTYYNHSDSYIETAELWIANNENIGGNLLDFLDNQTLINYIKAEIVCAEEKKEESDA